MQVCEFVWMLQLCLTNFSLLVQQIEVRLVAITIEFNSTLAHTPVPFFENTPFKCRYFGLSIVTCLFGCSFQTSSVYPNLPEEGCQQRDKVKKDIKLQVYYLYFNLVCFEVVQKPTFIYSQLGVNHLYIVYKALNVQCEGKM